MSRVQEASFAGNEVTLYCRSVRPEGRARACLAFLHGYGDHSGRYGHAMEWMAERGIECHALDFRGHGRSSGRRGHVERWEEYLDDLQSFLGLAPRHPDTGHPLFLLGHSHGGLVLAAAGICGLDGVAGCIFSAPYFRPIMRVPAWKVLLARSADPVLPWLSQPNGLRDEWMSTDEKMVRESGADPLICRTATPRWYLRHLDAQAEVMRRAPEFRLPALFLIPDADLVADSRAGHEFYSRAGSEDRTCRVYPGFRHELLREAGRERVFAHILSWIEERS